MTNRTASILLLFVATFAVSGVLGALIVASAARAGWALGPWVAPVFLFTCAVGIFFAGRGAVLPAALAAPAPRAFLLIAAWMAASLLATAAIVWLLWQTGISTYFRASFAVVTWLLVLVGSGALLAKHGSRFQSR